MTIDADELVAPNPPWGLLAADGTFVELPWGPLKRAGYREAPFDVRLPSGEVRHVIGKPAP